MNSDGLIIFFRAQRFCKHHCQVRNNCMKKVQFLILIFLVFIAGCSKLDNAKPAAVENTIIGKWSYTEYYLSIGGPGQWYPVTPANQVIEFKPDGTFIPSKFFLKDATKFEIVDSVTLKIQPASTPSGYILMGYSIKTAERELYLYPVSPYCIEGCSNKFKRWTFL